MSTELIRLRTALDRLDAAAHNEGITPDTILGAWHASTLELFEALYRLELTSEVRSEEVLTTAKAAAEAGAQTARLQVEAMQLELREIDRFIDQARISLGEKESATVQTLVDGFTEKAREVMTVRARAWSRTRYLQTAGALSFVGFLMFGGGYWTAARLPSNGAPHDFVQQCASSLRRDTSTGRTFCAVEVPGR